MREGSGWGSFVAAATVAILAILVSLAFGAKGENGPGQGGNASVTDLGISLNDPDPHLGEWVTFTVVLPQVPGWADPRIQIMCHQSGVLTDEGRGRTPSHSCSAVEVRSGCGTVARPTDSGPVPLELQRKPGMGRAGVDNVHGPRLIFSDISPADRRGPQVGL